MLLIVVLKNKICFNMKEKKRKKKGDEKSEDAVMLNYRENREKRWTT